jgi:hypothetical protein
MVKQENLLNDIHNNIDLYPFMDSIELYTCCFYIVNGK